MMGLSLFDSSSRTSQELEANDFTNTLGAEGSSRASLTNFGGIDITVKGKKNRADIINNIQLSDGGAIALAENVIAEGYEITSAALKSAGETANRAIDFAETRSASEGLDLLKSFGGLAVAAGAIFALAFVFRKAGS